MAIPLAKTTRGLERQVAAVEPLRQSLAYIHRLAAWVKDAVHRFLRRRWCGPVDFLTYIRSLRLVNVIDSALEELKGVAGFMNDKAAPRRERWTAVLRRILVSICRFFFGGVVAMLNRLGPGWEASWKEMFRQLRGPVKDLAKVRGRLRRRLTARAKRRGKVKPKGKQTGEDGGHEAEHTGEDAVDPGSGGAEPTAGARPAARRSRAKQAVSREGATLR